MMSAPNQQQMLLASPSAGVISAPVPPRNLRNDDFSTCCPSTFSCLLSTVCPCVWLGACTQIDYNTELVYLNYGKYLGVLREPGIICVNPAGMEKLTVSIAIQSLEVPSVKVVDVKGNPPHRLGCGHLPDRGLQEGRPGRHRMAPVPQHTGGSRVEANL